MSLYEILGIPRPNTENQAEVSSGMNVNIEMISPDKAKEMVGHNIDNRVVNRSSVKKYISELKNGEWSFTGESITFFNDGTICNGQHRLIACIESGIPFQTVVVRGVDSDAKTKTDTGRGRSGGDILTMFAGIRGKDANAASGAIKSILLYNRGYRYFSVGSYSGSDFLTNNSIKEFYLTHKSAMDYSINWVAENIHRHSPLLNRSQSIALNYLFNQASPATADDFLLKVLTGVNVEPKTTIATLRNYLSMDQMGVRKVSKTDRGYMTVKAFNSHNTGRFVKHAQNFRVKTGERVPFIKSRVAYQRGA